MKESAALKRELRRKMLEARGALSVEEQNRRSAFMTAVVMRQPFLKTSQNIAFYCPVRGEISPCVLLDEVQALAPAKNCFLPVVNTSPVKTLCFETYPGEAPYSRFQGKIAKPSLESSSIAPELLDLVFVPLVAFDSRGYRLGMGGGYYDRAFAFILSNRDRKISCPKLVGLAYSFQRIGLLPKEPWDVPLDGVATEEGYEPFDPMFHMEP